MLYDKKWDEKLPVNTENFKTAAELGLRDTEYSDLVRLLSMFEQNKIPARLFNMKIVGQPECGTPGCILGWARTFDRHAFTHGWHSTVDATLNFETCNLLAVNWGRATPAHAAKALRNYLTTGSARWHEVLTNN